MTVAAGPPLFYRRRRCFYETGSGIFYTDAEPHAARGEKEKSLAALKSMLAPPDDGLIPDRVAAGGD